jgi:hypothetical protein
MAAALGSEANKIPSRLRRFEINGMIDKIEWRL